MSAAPRKEYALRLRSVPWVLGRKTLVMGILNITSDSFSDGGRFLDFDRAVEQARRLVDEGADILDVGGESTRPFSEPVDLEEELSRVIPVIRKVREFSDIPVSIDTNKAEVARQALAAGADILNDVSGFRFDEDMAEVAAGSGVPVVLMHMLKTPAEMQRDPFYHSLFSEIVSFLENRIQYAVERGVRREQIIVDPGIGFGKTVDHNLRIVRNLEIFHALDRPLLLGASRKRFIGALLDRPEEEREVGTAAVNTWAVAAGAHIVRVHDVAFQKQAVSVADALRTDPGGTP